jgi:hypothetical protein
MNQEAKKSQDDVSVNERTEAFVGKGGDKQASSICAETQKSERAASKQHP